LLKIKPLIDGLERIDRHFGIVDGKLDYLNQVTTSAASAAATAASACAAVTADILKGK
jgi:hypothetical protein